MAMTGRLIASMGAKGLRRWSPIMIVIVYLIASAATIRAQDVDDAGITDPAQIAALGPNTAADSESQTPAEVSVDTDASPPETSLSPDPSGSTVAVAQQAAAETSPQPFVTSTADAAVTTAARAPDGTLTTTADGRQTRIKIGRPRQRSQAVAQRMEARRAASNPTAGVAAVTAMAMNPLYQAILDQHNTYRAQHQVGPLAWDDTLASQAASYAAKCHFAHDPNANAGENLFATSDISSSANALTSAITNWYNEVSLYNFNNPTWTPSAGHFTQVVWKSSTRLGCAAATCSSGLRGSGFTWPQGTYVVCRYAPAGNVIGQFASNVLPKGTAAPQPPVAQPPVAQPPPATPSPRPPTQIAPGTLPAGYKFSSPGCLSSANGRFRLCLQGDGRLVLVDGRAGSAVIWTTRRPTTVRPPYKLTMQTTGRLVVHDVTNTAVWSTPSPRGGVAPYKLVVQDNGNVVVLDSRNVSVWATNTARA